MLAQICCQEILQTDDKGNACVRNLLSIAVSGPISFWRAANLCADNRSGFLKNAASSARITRETCFTFVLFFLLVRGRPGTTVTCYYRTAYCVPTPPLRTWHDLSTPRFVMIRHIKRVHKANTDRHNAASSQGEATFKICHGQFLFNS
jgi:hypothetical protein